MLRAFVSRPIGGQGKHRTAQDQDPRTSIFHRNGEKTGGRVPDASILDIYGHARKSFTHGMFKRINYRSSKPVNLEKSLGDKPAVRHRV